MIFSPINNCAIHWLLSFLPQRLEIQRGISRKPFAAPHKGTRGCELAGKGQRREGRIKPDFLQLKKGFALKRMEAGRLAAGRWPRRLYEGKGFSRSEAKRIKGMPGQ